MRDLVAGAGAVGGGFLAMVGLAFLSFTVALVWLGEEAFRAPGTFEASHTWGTVSALLGLSNALVGGAVCACIARRRAPVWTLAALLVAIGIAHGAFTSLWGATARSGHEDLLEVQLSIHGPAWLLVALPFLDGIGTVGGGALVLRRRRKAGGRAEG